MKKFASKTMFLIPFCGSIGRGDARTVMADREMNPGEVMFVVLGRERCFRWVGS
jgi:hypothetical protein